MRLTIIPCDKSVYIDGLSYLGIDMTWVPEIEGKQVHAVQWYNGEGEVEFVGNFENLKIKKLGVFEKAVELWNAKKKEIDELERQRLEEEQKVLMELEERKKYELDMMMQFEIETRELELLALAHEEEARAHEERCLAEIREMEAQAREFEEAAAAVAAALKEEEEYELARRSIPAAIFVEENDPIGENDIDNVNEDGDEDEDLFFDIEELLREI